MRLARMPGARGTGWIHSLKGRLGLILFGTAIVPIALIGYISFNFIYVVQAEKINGDFQLMVDNEKEAIEKSLANLSVISQLFAEDGGLGQDQASYLAETEPVKKVQLYLQIDRTFSSILFSNPDLNAAFTFTPSSAGGRIYFPSAEMKEETFVPADPVLYTSKRLTFYGPHPSRKKNDDSLVFSLTRTVWDYRGQTMNVYLETNFSQLMDTPSWDQERMNHLIVGQNGNVLFSDIDDGRRLSDFKSFESVSEQGWTIRMLMPLSSYQKVTSAWWKQFVTVAAFSLLFSAFSAWIIAITVYRPIKRMNEEISHFSYNQAGGSAYRPGLREFQYLFDNFRKMRTRIIELIGDVEAKEKRRGELEVEKLLVQINPHFLHNTLNTIQWLARLKGQTDIAKLVSVFTRVLHYNLGKMSIIVTLRDEVQSLLDYIELQNIRYNYKFKIEVSMDETLGDTRLPRFLLQPLVENALYHGQQSDDGTIAVEIEETDANRYEIRVFDNGKGIPPDKLNRLLEEDGASSSGLGIGLKYVKKMLSVYYENDARFHIVSAPGEGTRITIGLPKRIAGDKEDGT